MSLGPNHQPDMKVGDIVSASGGWDMGIINNLCTEDIISDIINTPIPTTTNVNDKPSWRGTGSAKFSTAKCYDILHDEENNHNHNHNHSVD